MNKDIETPFGIFSRANRAVIDVAICREERGKTAKNALCVNWIKGKEREICRFRSLGVYRTFTQG